ncbi:dihydrodipicolinate synthase family protein [Actinopolymorpha sp. B11F2]|uniref:dihydrodipicolinate synthase family protein n=1 Tax=Actinopolymorpha sp. B11F2 TaxID=3160862 RepID=UPI0032E42A96
MLEEGLRGIYPPVVLPFGADGTIDHASLEHHIEHLLAAGVHGLWINGTTGEFHALDADQRLQAVRVAVKAARGSVPVIAHVGDTSTGLVIGHARSALAAGADQVAIVPPYFVDFTQDELRQHVRRVVGELGVPVLVYHLPQLAKVGLTVDSIATLAQEGAVVGVKDSSNDMVWFRQLLSGARAAGISLACFTGGSSMTDVGLYLGAAGAMSSAANLTPRHLVGMYDAATAGDWVRLRAMQEEMETLLAALRLPRRAGTFSATAGVHKYVLTVLGHIAGDFAAEPLAPLDEDERRHLASTAVPIVERLEGRTS